MTETVPKRIDRYIPWMIVGFFVVVAIFDGIFVYLATSTHTGVVTDHAYQRGLKYNQTVSAANRQQALGWQASLELQNQAQLVLKIADKDGQSINGATVQAQIQRPTQDGYDFETDLSNAGGGTYWAPVTFPLPGQWDVKVLVTWKQEQFQLSKRLVITP